MKFWHVSENYSTGWYIDNDTYFSRKRILINKNLYLTDYYTKVILGMTFKSNSEPSLGDYTFEFKTTCSDSDILDLREATLTEKFYSHQLLFDELSRLGLKNPEKNEKILALLPTLYKGRYDDHVVLQTFLSFGIKVIIGYTGIILADYKYVKCLGVYRGVENIENYKRYSVFSNGKVNFSCYMSLFSMFMKATGIKPEKNDSEETLQKKYQFYKKYGQIDTFENFIDLSQKFLEEKNKSESFHGRWGPVIAEYKGYDDYLKYNDLHYTKIYKDELNLISNMEIRNSVYKILKSIKKPKDLNLSLYNNPTNNSFTQIYRKEVFPTYLDNVIANKKVISVIYKMEGIEEEKDVFIAALILCFLENTKDVIKKMFEYKVLHESLVLLATMFYDRAYILKKSFKDRCLLYDTYIKYTSIII